MIIRSIKKTAVAGSVLFFLTGCSPDVVEDEGRGLTTSSADAAFTVTKTAENKFHLKRTYHNFINSEWNIDDDGFANGKNEIDIFLPDAGTYVIRHNAVGIGGQVAGTASHTVVVPNSDPVAGNIIQGGRFDTPEEISKWSIHNISTSGAQWVFANGQATIVAHGSSQQAIYQAVQVTEGQKYSVDMVVSSDTALEDTWFEVYFLKDLPAPGNDINAKVYRNINTWSGCGKGAFKGRISAVGCDGSKNAGIYTADATGKVYLVIKCGGKTVKSLNVDKVEMRRLQ